MEQQQNHHTSGPLTSSQSASADSLLLQAARGEELARPPVWFMRQAGRSLPEYRQARKNTTMLEACANPELVAEITLQPVRRYGVDAAIVYSDIVVPLKWAGVGVDIVPGTGPVVENPIRTAADVAALPELHLEQVEPLTKAISLILAELGPTPLIGFAGAPYTLASYLIEGGPSKNHELTKAMMWNDPQTWNALLKKLATMTSTFLEAQLRAGAAAMQLFDSWVGALPATDYRAAVKPHTRHIFEHIDGLDLGRSVPKIHFGVGTGELIADMSDVGADVVGIDFRIPLDVGSARAGNKPVQGNLDPAVLFASPEVIEQRTREVVAAGRRTPGHIFNLGHGVMPATHPDALARVVDTIHACG